MFDDACLPDSLRKREDHTRNVLVIDTDPGVRWSIEKGLAYSGYTVRTASTVDQAIRIAQEGQFGAILMELMPEAGLTVDVLSSLVGASGSPSVLCASIDSAPHTVIECMRRGAVGFLPKPFGLATVRAELARALKERRTEAERPEEPSAYEPSLLIGVSSAIQELRATIKQVAQTDLNCVIRGESGVGKDLVAREIHRLSLRRDHPFIKVNSGAIPEQLLESELFGYEKGAFTGAMASKPGRFSLANKGVIFLDEICEIPMSLQAKLLQVIEHKEFTKLGGRHSVTVDVQILAATNADVDQRLHDGAFRQDLFFRLNEVCIWVPSLRERREDIPLLVRHFVHKYSHFTGSMPFELSGEDIATLCEQDWPGNVRELENTTKRWLALRTRDVKSSSAPIASVASNTLPETDRPAKDELKEGEPTPEQILKTLDQFQWHRQKAAQALNMSYQALRRRIIKYRLDKRG
jgi:two-component system response regulator AtoC